MTEKVNNIIACRVTDDDLDKLNKFIKENKLKNKSEAVRYLINKVMR